MAAVISFGEFTNELIHDLQILGSESKRRNSDIKQSCEKSIEILKRSHTAEELKRHPDFVDPFTAACMSDNAKLTSIAMHSMQRMAAIKCVPNAKLDEILDALLHSTQLASEIQFKVLQLIPTLFKTYIDVITNGLLKKLFSCCTKLLQLPNKTAVLVGTVNATLQQLVDEVFDRCELETKQEELFEVSISNEHLCSVNSYRYDAHQVLVNLSQINDSHFYDDAILDVKSIPEDCGLEILEFVISNHATFLCQFEDLRFLLRTKVVPLLLRTFSVAKYFPTSIRSARCIKLLLTSQFFAHLELEAEIMLWLLIHTLSDESDSPMWKKIISLEIFESCSRDYDLVTKIFESYDALEERKNICTSLLDSIYHLVDRPEYQNLLAGSDILLKGDTLILEKTTSSTMILLDLLDKSSPPLIDQPYIIYLLLVISNNFSDGMGTRATSEASDSSHTTKSLEMMYVTLYPLLIDIHKKFLYSTTLDAHLFRSLIRAFQKLTMVSGILSLDSQLEESLSLFSTLIANNVTRGKVSFSEGESSGAVLSAFGDTLIGVATTTLGEKKDDVLSDNEFHARIFHQRNMSMFRALMSLSISVGSSYTSNCWDHVLKTWQWVSYFIYGPSPDFLESYYGKDIPPCSSVSKQDVLVYENSVKKFVEGSINYSHSSAYFLLKCLISKSSIALSQAGTGRNEMFDSEGNLELCPYNPSFFITEMCETFICNYERIISVHKDEDIWELINSHLIEVMATRAQITSPIRLHISRAYSDMLVEFTSKCNRNEKLSSSRSEIQDRVLNSLLLLIKSIRSLPITNESIYSNDTNIEIDIILQALKTLNDLLDNFGESLESWDIVFKIINSPFEFIGDENMEHFSEQERKDILQIMIKKQEDIIQLSFEVFKLITDNFLQTLPLKYFKVLIDTLINFVIQKRNLNISFSSVSQFWLISDCLRMQTIEEEPVTMDSLSQQFDEKALVGLLEENGIFSHKIVALSIYLLQKLVYCTTDTRSEVKNGSIQTFFGILDANSSLIPSWYIVATTVLQPLLTYELPVDNADDFSEFAQLSLKGLIQVFTKNLVSFSHPNDMTEQWRLLISHMEKLLTTKSFEVVYVVCQSLKRFLETCFSLDQFPIGLVKDTCRVWSSYAVVYTTSVSGQMRKKTNSDCIIALLDCYGPLYNLCEKYGLITAEFIEKSMITLNSAARYPLLPDHVIDKKRPSPLQKSLLSAIDTIRNDLPAELEIMVILQLAYIVNMPFDTRSRIEKKLTSKLGDNITTRIPSFEALSYLAGERLYQRVIELKDLDKIFVENKALPKLLHTLVKPLKNASKTVMVSENDEPLWQVNCDAFYHLSCSFLAFLGENPVYLQCDTANEYLKVLMDSLTGSLLKDSQNPDANTEKYTIKVYSKLKELLKKCLSLGMLSEEGLQPFGSALWISSFYYEVDEIEDAIIKSCSNLEDIVKTFAQFDFINIVGSTVEPKMLPNCEFTKTSLDDLVEFCILEIPNSDAMRNVCFAFMLARVAFVLRKFIADQQLLLVQPISKVRVQELQQVSHGLLQVLKFYESTELMSKDLSLLSDFYPLLLKAIPLSQRVHGLQDELLQIALSYAKFKK